MIDFSLSEVPLYKIFIVFFHTHFLTHPLQTQLKDYDKDILQELWKIRNTIQTLRETEKKSRKDVESRFLDDTIDDRSPTPKSQQSNKTDDDEQSLPSSPSSPVTDFVAADGDRYTESTLQRMVTAPTHLRKSSDDKVLEEFFGSEQLTKLDMFKKQISTEDVTAADTENPAADKHLMQIPEGESEVVVAVGTTAEEKTPHVQESTRNDSKTTSSSSLVSSESKGEIRLRVAKNRLSDANRVSYDVASEMEKLRARLQETTKQELAEFDRKYSPKLYHSGMLGIGEEVGEVGGVGGGAWEATNSHSRQGSLDSSIPNKQAAPGLTTPAVRQLITTHSHHTRQHSLPVDPTYFRQLQQSNETAPPPPFFGHTREISGDSLSSDGGAFSPPLTPNHQTRDRSQSLIPLHNPAPLLIRAVHPMAGGGVPGQHKQSKPPGMSRMSSEGGTSSSQQLIHSQNRPASASTSSMGREGKGQVNGNNRSRVPSNPQLHYSTTVLKKRSSQDLSSSFLPSSTHPGVAVGANTGKPHPGVGVGNTGKPHPGVGGGNTTGMGKGVYRYDAKVPNGRPHAYEQPKRRSYGEEMDSETKQQATRGNVGGSTSGRYVHTQLSPTRLEGNISSASPRAIPDRRGTVSVSDTHQTQYSNNKVKLQTRVSSGDITSVSSSSGRRTAPGQPSQEEIEPYMTSSHVKSQMQKLNYSYTPFSHQPQQQPQQQRANTVTAADAPKLSRKQNNSLRSSENTWI